MKFQYSPAYTDLVIFHAFRGEAEKRNFQMHADTEAVTIAANPIRSTVSFSRNSNGRNVYME